MESSQLINVTKESYMHILPFSNNHIAIFGRKKDNFIDIRTDMSDEDQIFITTKSGYYTIDNKGFMKSGDYE